MEITFLNRIYQSTEKKKAITENRFFFPSLSYRVPAPDWAFALHYVSPPPHFTLAGRVTAVVFHGHPPVAPLAARPMSDHSMLITVLSVHLFHFICSEASEVQLLRHLGE
ncbi:hypothetical protein TNIN_443791 [Trichonephila inaurata madagascariensis]|uniref:Uncharacterized protein n=1 Tax=Trichonephila inaurata madagascariensis TaxID=2747483 RepID=A0A8X6M8S5_9ARAC|nr:hypothetical protein TNIN_443791 [Trichonephila inaurata madagascariensis]